MRFTLLTAVTALIAGGCDDGRPPPLNSGSSTTTLSGGDGDGDGDGDYDAGPSIDADPNARRVTGLVCLVEDMRFPLDCPSVDLAGVVVRELGTTNSTTAAANGSFAIDVISTESLVYFEVGASATSLRGTVVAINVGATGTTNAGLSVIDLTYWSSLVTATIGAEAKNSAVITAYLLDNDSPAIGAEVIQPTGTLAVPFYDNGAPLTWTQVGLSGNQGTALMFNVPVLDDNETFTALNNSASVVVQIAVPVRAELTTIVGVDLTD